MDILFLSDNAKPVIRAQEIAFRCCFKVGIMGNKPKAV